MASFSTSTASSFSAPNNTGSLTSVTLKTFNGTDIRRFTLPTSALMSYTEIVRKICDVYGLEVPTFLADYHVEIFSDGWDAPRPVRCDGDLHAIKELAPSAVRDSQLFRVRILVNFDSKPASVAASPSPATPTPAPVPTPVTKVMTVNKAALAAIRETFKEQQAGARQTKIEARSEVSDRRQEVRSLRLKLKEACKQARIARVEGDFEQAQDMKEHAKESVRAARERLMEAETRLADCKGNVRRLKEQMRSEVLAARMEMAEKGASSDSTTSGASGVSGPESDGEQIEAAAAAITTNSASPSDLQTGDRVVLQSSVTKGMVMVNSADKTLTATGHRGRAGRYIVTRCDDLVQFQNVLTGTYLRIDKDRAANARGSGGFCTWFRPIATDTGAIAFQSVYFDKVGGARVFLNVASDSLGVWEDDGEAIPASARFTPIKMRSGGGARAHAAEHAKAREAGATGEASDRAPRPFHRFGGGFGGNKRARIAELERENASLMEENQRLKAALAVAPVATTTSTTTAATTAPAATPTPTTPAPTTPAGGKAASRGERLGHRLAGRMAAAAAAAKETPTTLAPGDVVFFQAQASGSNLRIRKNGRVDGNGGFGDCARLRVAGVRGDAIQLTNSKDQGFLLCVTDAGELCAVQDATPGTWLRVVRHDDGLCSLQSAHVPDAIVGVVASGEAKCLRDAAMNMDAPHGQFRLTLA